MRLTLHACHTLPPASYLYPKAYNLIFICTSDGAGLTVATDGVHLLSDVTGRASGEAFVHFVDKESAQEALNRDREKIGHRWGAKLFTMCPRFEMKLWWELRAISYALYTICYVG